MLAYVARLGEELRRLPQVRLGLSMRGGLAYVRCAKTWAAAQGRHFVVPDDVKDLAEPVLAHRVLLDPEAEFEGTTVESLLQQVLADVRPPADRVGV